MAAGHSAARSHVCDEGHTVDSLASVVGTLAEAVRPERWHIRTDLFWCYATPPGHLLRQQGWKLHISATPRSAPLVLRRAVPVLFDECCAFKCVATMDGLEELIAAHCERETAGKFMTVYPRDDDQFRRIASELHAVTAGLPGPPVLSDRPYRDGSIVFYRYGSFTSVKVLMDSGSYQPALVTPSGEWVPDRRSVHSASPAWAECPIAPGSGPAARWIAPHPAAAGTDRSLRGLLADRYQVREAIRHSYRGGVYRGTDTRTGQQVIIKQARPHVGADDAERDCRYWLRREGRMLDILAPLGFVPRKLDIVDVAGHVFLVQAQLPGSSLRHWLEQRAGGADYGGIPHDEMLTVARGLVSMLSAVHGMGLGVRDLNPANVIVSSASKLWLIDVEGVSPPGEATRRLVTPGFTAPEQAAAPPYGPAPALTSDLYSLGMTLLYLATGMEPALLEDDPPGRPAGARAAALIDLAAAQSPDVRPIAPLLKGLTNDNPHMRWPLPRVARFLARLAGNPPGQRTVGRDSRRDGNTPGPDQLISDGLAYLGDTMTADGPHLWPPVRWQAEESDPYNAAAGAGGILAVLSRASKCLDDPAVRATTRTAAHWLGERMAAEPRVLPGLFYGRTGTAWALLDAARCLGDEELGGQARAIAGRVPIRWPRPDITHGLAGAGMAMLHLWRSTGDPEFAERASAYAYGVLGAAERNVSGIRWPLADVSSPSRSAHYGFAHGVAGIAAFLLAAGQFLGLTDALDTAVACGDVLCRAAVIKHGAAWWPVEDRADDSAVGHWCSGSSGIGSFLIRLWRQTLAAPLLELAEHAAVAVHRDRWAYSPVICHGLAGNCDFLLDMAAATGEERYRRWAQDLADCIAVRTALRNGYSVPPGDDFRRVDTGYHTGLAGVLSVQLRLRYGGPRMWTVDPVDLSSPAVVAC